ncbi:hypothetical protein [Paenibacillus sp. NEAU-GSW1]|uniref:hypothetical protein n=1 Tax=Paenibacillus sp. NEAU-GSW1 TaxID=2682486 RepID=UPI0012E129A7|nr:hypothetical protein [Paenibacillus sp. NEAU-GSW1]MUT65904.1 hypothetical protein [Paenibacillus sp. NEAU-GSW1]
MTKHDQEQEQTICPWCMTEIVWDEEIGIEKHCPHCDNELSGYRTVQIGIDRDDEDEDQEDQEPEWDAQDEDDSYGGQQWSEGDEGFRRTNRAWLGVEEKLQQIVDHQEEAPECPSCREYMIEAGKQKINVEPTIHPAVGKPLVQSPFETVIYICPACFNTSAILSDRDREVLVKALSPKE